MARKHTGRTLFYMVRGSIHIENTNFQRTSDILHQSAFENIREDRSILKTYSLLNIVIGYEKYLTEITSVQIGSNHILTIEKDIHIKPERNERFSPFCPQHIEDEIHFFLIL